MEDKFILTTEPCCDTISKCDCGTPTPLTTCKCDEPNQVIVNPDEENRYAEFVKLAAVLQDSILYSWKLHLKAKKYSVHVILEEYYDEAFDIIDGLIEHYQGICKCDIIDNDVVSGERLKLVELTKDRIFRGLTLLGIDSPEAM